MRIIKSGFIAVVFFSTILLGANNFLLDSSKQSNDKLFENFNLNFTNTSTIFSATSSKNVYLTATVLINHEAFTYESSYKSMNPTIEFSYPGKMFLLTASLSLERNSTKNETFLINKSVYQPDKFFLTKYASLDGSNKTVYEFKTNIAMIGDLSNVNLINSTSKSYFYKYIYSITENKSIILVDSYYRHFSDYLLPLKKGISNSTNPGSSGPTIPIITINSTQNNESNNSQTVLNTTIINKHFESNETIITGALLTNTTIKSNFTTINDSKIFDSKINSNSSIIGSANEINNSSINSQTINITDSIISNSIITVNDIMLSNTVINCSIIKAKFISYSNVTFINQTSTADVVFNYSVNHFILENNSIIVNISTNEISNISVSLTNTKVNLTRDLYDKIGISSVLFSNLNYSNYTLRVKFLTAQNKNYSYSVFINLSDTQTPTLVNYSIKTGYTDVQSFFNFSEPVFGIISLYDNNSLVNSSSLNWVSQLNFSNFLLNPFGSYFFRISVYDSNSNFLNESLTNFSLTHIMDYNFSITTNKNSINNTETTLSIIPSLMINNKSYYNPTNKLMITVSFTNNYTIIKNSSYGIITIFFDPTILQSLPNSQFIISATLIDFNFSCSKIMTLYTPQEFNYTVLVNLDQSTTNETATLSIATNINASEIIYFGVINQSQSFTNLTILNTSKSITFDNLQYKSYNLTILFTSWDNQKAIYYYYFTVNDTLSPKIMSYTVLPTYTSINFSISFSELVSASIQTYSVTNGSLVDAYLDYNYKYSFSNFINGLSPYQEYKIVVFAQDPAGNQVSFNISQISMKSVVGRELKTTIDKSVILSNDNTILFNTTVIINNISLDEQLELSTNVTYQTYNCSTGSFNLRFDPILLNSLKENTVINVTIRDPIFLISKSILLIYVLQDYGNNSPVISLASNSSFISNNTPLSLHIQATFIPSGTFQGTTIMEIQLVNTTTSLGYYIVNSYATLFNSSITLKPIFYILNGYITLRIIIFGNNIFKTVNKTITFQIDSSPIENPILLSHSITLDNTSTMLSLQAKEPVNIKINYGTTMGSFSTYIYPLSYSSEVYLNLSSFMTLNNSNYYSIIITDSKGTKSVYDNNTNYFRVFVQNLDIISPYNTTLILITSDYHIQFTANEPVLVTVFCQDYFSTVSTCYTSTTYSTSIYGLLSLSMPGMYYTITQVSITDKTGNLSIIYPNIVFYFT